MANLTSSSYSRVVKSPSLLESLTIHPVLPCFRLGMDERVDEYMKSIESSPSLASAVDCRNPSASVSDVDVGSSLHLWTSQPQPKEYGGGRKRPPLQPHPQNIEPLSKRFKTLNNEELEKISKPFIPKNMVTSTRWALENFHCWLRHRNSTAKEDTDKCPVTLLEDMDSN